MSENVEISVADLEALMMAASCVKGVYAAIDAHDNDVAVNRTRDHVAQAIRNANRQICNARRIKDPLEDEPPSSLELDTMRGWLAGRADGSDLSPQDPHAVSMIRKRLIVMGHLDATIHWGDKTTETQASDRILWKLTKKGEDYVSGILKPIAAIA